MDTKAKTAINPDIMNDFTEINEAFYTDVPNGIASTSTW